MNVLVAIDSFKGSLSSLEAGEACARGIKKASPGAGVTVMSLADGGEGTVSALTEGMGGKYQTVKVRGPLKRDVEAVYGIVGGDTAIMEMSAAAGITLISETERDPMKTATYGVGQIIKDAVGRGCRKFIVGIGGSATNDGGVGMLMALGYEFKDESGKDIPLGALGLKDIATISDRKVIKELRECEFRIACDVNNPLCGKSGCSYVFGPQKGATPKMAEEMDAYLRHYASKTEEFLNKQKLASYPGTGAAGGLGFAFHAYLNGVLESGISIVLDEIRLEDYVKNVDVVVTGEGRLDSQTVMGKAPIGVARLAKKYNKKVIAFSGCVTSDAGIINEHGIDAFFPILRSVCSLEEAIDKENAANNLTAAAEQVFRLIK